MNVVNHGGGMSANGDMNLSIGMKFNDYQAKKDLDNTLNQLEQKAIIKTKIQIDDQHFNKTVSTYRDAIGNLIEVTEYWNVTTGKAFKEITNLTSVEKQITQEEKKHAQATQQLAQSQDKLNKSAKQSVSIFQDFANTFLKMAKFNTINIIYDNLTQSISNVITITKEFNDATTELRKVSDLEGDSLKAYAQNLAEYGEEVGRTMTDMVNSATIFKRTGATDEEAMKLAQIAEMYRNIADNEISSAEASSFLVSQMKAFNITADQSIRIINAVNEVANRHAVSTNDLQIALSKASASLATANNSYEETIALVEGATAIMQGQAGTVGNGLRTLAINVASLATESDNFVSASGKVNIALKDEQGQLRSTYSILNDLSQVWGDLNSSEQMAVAKELGGKTRFNVITSLMRNFADAQQSLTDALDSTGSAIQENERYMESISAKQAKWASEVQKFVLGDGGLEAFEKKLLDIGVAIMQFINDIGGLKNVMVSFGTILAISIIPNVIKLSENVWNLADNITTTIRIFSLCRKEGMSFADSLKYIGISANFAQLAIQGVIAIIGVAIIAYNAYQKSQEEAKQMAHETNEATLEQINSIQQQLNSLKKENQSREDLVKAIQAVDEAYKDEGQTLDEINKKRQESINKLKEEAQAKLEDAKESGLTQYRKDKDIISQTYLPTKQLTVEADYYGITLNTDGIENYINSLKDLRKAENEANVNTTHLNKAIDELETQFKEAQNGISNYESILDALNLKYDEESGKIVRLNTLEIVAKQQLQETNEVTETSIDRLDKLGVSLDVINDKLSDTDFDNFITMLNEGDIEGATALLESYGIEVNNVNENLTEFESVVADFIGYSESAQSAYETLNKAVEEYNKQGYLSASTLKQLTKIQPEYLAQLDLTGEKAEVVNGALQNQFETEKKLALIHIQTAEQLDIVTYCEQYLGEEIDKTTNALADDVINAQALTTAYGQLTDAGYKASQAIATVRAKGRDDDTFYAGLEERRKRWKSYYDEVSAIELDYTNNSKSNAGKSKDAWVEAFKEEQRQLKHLLETDEITEYEYYERLKDLNEKYFGEISGKHQKYIKEYQENEEEIYKGIKAVYDKVKDYLAKSIEQGYEKAINALKKEEKRVLDEIKQQLEALKKERDKVLKGIKKQIDALKREKEKVQKYWNDQIDAIKRENEVLQKQNELIEYQQALQRAKSQKVMVLQDGKFQLSENESAVAEAEHNLAEYQDQLSYEQQIQQMEDLRDAQIETLEDRIQALEDYYDYMEEYYDNQIDAMEEYQKQVERQYEQQIDALQEQLDTFKEGYQKTEDLENAKLATAVLTANQEAKIWEVRLDNLSQFIDAYNKLMGQLNMQDGVFNPNMLYNPVTASFTPSTSIGGVDSNIATRSSGDAYFANDEIALVGESPNTELVLGSKVNTGGGKFLHLSKGSGVVNAESTRTLAGILNGINNVPVTNNSRSVQQSFNFGTISLPNVTNAESFVDALSTRFNNYSIQYSNTR